MMTLPLAMKRRRARPRDRGFTLIETLIAVALLSFGVLVSLMFFVRANISSQLARDMTMACAHADFVFEEMVGRTHLSDITGTDWTTWAEQAGLDTLPEEEVTVSFKDPEGDPLKVDLHLSWKRKERAYHIDMTTELTK